MIHRFKNLKTLNGKKRYIVLGFLAVELMSLPAAAQIVHKVAFDIRPIVTAVEIPTAEPIGEVSVNVHVSGSLSGANRFGDAAQLPGPESICSEATGLNSAIYQADRKTAAKPGTPPEQAVIMEFTYDASARPNFEFIAGKNETAPISACSPETS